MSPFLRYLTRPVKFPTLPPRSIDCSASSSSRFFSLSARWAGTLLIGSRDTRPGRLPCRSSGSRERRSREAVRCRPLGEGVLINALIAVPRLQLATPTQARGCPRGTSRQVRTTYFGKEFFCRFRLFFPRLRSWTEKNSDKKGSLTTFPK